MMRAAFSIGIAVIMVFASSEFADWTTYVTGAEAPSGWLRFTVQLVFVSACSAAVWLHFKQTEGRS